ATSRESRSEIQNQARSTTQVRKRTTRHSNGVYPSHRAVLRIGLYPRDRVPQKPSACFPKLHGPPLNLFPAIRKSRRWLLRDSIPLIQINPNTYVSPWITL